MTSRVRAALKLSALATLISLANLTAGNAATFTWDITPGTVGAGNGAINNGAGAWNTTATNGVWTSDSGATNVAWVNSATAPHSAIFGGGTGAAGTVTVTTVNVQDITFNAPGSGTYSLTGSTITLGNTTAGVNTPTPTITTNVSASIASVLAGNDGLIKNGAGILTLSGTNTYTGGTTINAGTVSINAGAAIGKIRGVVTINPGATLTSTGANSLGYNTDGTQVTELRIAGGTYNNAINGNQGISTNVIMTGGTLSSTGGGLFFFNTGYGITSLDAATTALISSPIRNQNNNNLTINVARSTTPSVTVDLHISGVIDPFPTSVDKLTKTIYRGLASRSGESASLP